MARGDRSLACSGSFDIRISPRYGLRPLSGSGARFLRRHVRGSRSSIRMGRPVSKARLRNSPAITVRTQALARMSPCGDTKQVEHESGQDVPAAWLAAKANSRQSSGSAAAGVGRDAQPSASRSRRSATTVTSVEPQPSWLEVLVPLQDHPPPSRALSMPTRSGFEDLVVRFLICSLPQGFQRQRRQRLVH
jgi:hypothetical protein